MKKDSEVLSDMRFALTPREHWTKMTFARNAEGSAVDEYRPSAVSWCLSGAAKAAGGNTAYLRRYFSVPDSMSVVTYNDHPRRTHAQILNQLDRAIEKALKLEELNETSISS